MLDFLTKVGSGLSRGPLLIVIVLVLTISSYYFMFSFLPHHLKKDPYEDVHSQGAYSFIMVSYSICVILAFWALAMTSIVGPGYCS